MPMPLGTKLTIGFVVVALGLVMNAIFMVHSTERLTKIRDLHAQAYHALSELQATLSAMKDLEAGQRTFLLTGDEKYLAPFLSERSGIISMRQRLRSLKELTRGTPHQQQRLDRLVPLIEYTLTEFQRTTDLRVIKGVEAAMRNVLYGPGMQKIGQIERLIAEMEKDDRELLQQREHEAQAITQQTVLTLEVTTLLVFALLWFVFRRLQHDIRARKQAERDVETSELKYRRLFEAAKDGILILDPETGQILEVNPFLKELLGYSDEELLGKTLCDVGFVPDSAVSKVSFEELKAVGYMRQDDLPLQTKGGQRLTVEFVSHTYQVNHTTVIQCNIRDITGRKKAEQEKADLEQHLRQAQKMEAIGLLAGGIAHDFNNLLTVIIGYSEVSVQKLDAHDPRRKDIEHIKHAGERASLLTRQLLAFSRKQVLQPQILDLNTVVRNLEDMLRRLIGENIQLHASLKPHLGLVNADLGQIEQVLLNLVVNARDAMPRGGQLTIETANVQMDHTYVTSHIGMQEGSWVMLTVSDTGCGMSPDVQARLFEPFFTTKGPRNGTGLGLSMTYGIVKQSGGFISVYSQLGQGTVFKVYLPQVHGTLPAAVVSTVTGESARGTETILLVEDEEAVRTFTRAVLEQQGYTMLDAKDFKEACILAGQYAGPIHLLLTDVVMPGGSGREVAEHLHLTRPNLKVLFMSGYTDDAIVRHGVRDSQVAFLQKPLYPSTLARKVREVLAESLSTKQPERS